jgi:hypothetical protein
LVVKARATCPYEEDTLMNTTTPMLRELTIRYAVKADQAGHPVLLGQALTTPQGAADLLLRVLGDEATEVFALLLLSTRHEVVAYHEVSRGTLDSTLVHPRLCAAQHKRGYVAAVVMWRRRMKARKQPAFHGPRTPHNRTAFARSLDLLRTLTMPAGRP